jgi:hypothetical protein
MTIFDLFRKVGERLEDLKKSCQSKPNNDAIRYNLRFYDDIKKYLSKNRFIYQEKDFSDLRQRVKYQERDASEN